MRIHWVAGLFAGSIVVHAVVVACNPAGNAAANGTTPTAVEVAEEPCDKTYEIQVPAGPLGPDAGTTRTLYFAEHHYPGKSKEEIAGHISHWTPITDSTKDVRPAAYIGGLNLQSAVYTRDEYAGAGCTEGT